MKIYSKSTSQHLVIQVGEISQDYSRQMMTCCTTCCTSNKSTTSRSSGIWRYQPTAWSLWRSTVTSPSSIQSGTTAR